MLHYSTCRTTSSVNGRGSVCVESHQSTLLALYHEKRHFASSALHACCGQGMVFQTLTKHTVQTLTGRQCWPTSSLADCYIAVPHVCCRFVCRQRLHVRPKGQGGAAGQGQPRFTAGSTWTSIQGASMQQLQRVVLASAAHRQQLVARQQQPQSMR